MKDVKHSKFKNIGIIFEILSNQLTAEILTDKQQMAMKIIKKYFKEGSEIKKELYLYNLLTNNNLKNTVSISKLIDKIISERKKLDKFKLNKEKYNLIREIKNNYDIDSLFQGRIPGYKMHATIYKLFESNDKKLNESYINLSDSLITQLTGKENNEQLSINNKLSKEPTQIQALAFDMIIEKFNKKYSTLNENQRRVITTYINENVSSPKFKDFLLNEIKTIKKQLNELKKNNNYSNKKALKIKIDEVINLLSNISTSRYIKDEHVDAIIKYYELIGLVKCC